MKVRAGNAPADSGRKGAIYNHVSTKYVEEGIRGLKMHEE